MPLLTTRARAASSPPQALQPADRGEGYGSTAPGRAGALAPNSADELRKRRESLPRAGWSPRLGGILSACANPGCSTGWLHLLRRRNGPIFEGGWSCSAACTAARLEAAVRREMAGRTLDAPGQASRVHDPSVHRHRVPLGLVMLEQGWITPEQLRQALDAQKAASQGRLGEWLVRHLGISEQTVTRALGLQWNCPVLSLEAHDPEAVAAAMPRLFIDAFAALPLRVAAGAILYLGFEERLDPVVALSLERMVGLRVEAGLVHGSLFPAAQRRMLNAVFPKVKLIESASEAPVARVLAREIERDRPVESKLVRVHDCLWLRMWLVPQSLPLPDPASVEDVICSFTPDFAS